MLEKNITKNKISYNMIICITTHIVALYISCVLSITYAKMLSLWFLFPMFYVGTYFGLSYMHEKLKECNILLRDNAKYSERKIFVLIFVAIMVGQMIYWLAYYPGGFNLDAYGQWDQVHGLQPLRNWHPVFTTFCYWLITRVCDSFAFCIFAQLVIFSLSISYLLLKLFWKGLPKEIICVSTVYIAINPAIGLNNVSLIKDVPFAIALIWLVVIFMNIYETDGDWIQKPINIIKLIGDLIAITLIRHNGIFIIIPSIIIVLCLYKKHRKYILGVIALYVLLMITIQGPIYETLRVEEHTNTVGESVGIPMSIMANCLVYDYENTPDDVKEYLLEIADKREWIEYYELGEWDSCKWEFGGINLLKGESLKEILSLTIKAIAACPDAAYRSIRENTRVVWQIIGEAEWSTWVYIEENDYGINPDHNYFFSMIAEKILLISETIVGATFCWNIGVANIAYFVLMLIVIIRKEIKKLIFIIPIISYNLLTMLLLCGPSHRYFYFNHILIIPLALYLLYVRENRELL